MRPYDPTKPLVSIHIPKAGGTSLASVLRLWFPGDRFRLHYRHADQLPQKHELRGAMCVHGHFNGARGFGVWQYYPEATQFIAFLRDPFDRFVSQWLYMHRCKRNGERVADLDGEPSFESWLRQRAEEQREGRNSYSPVWFLPQPPGAMDLDRLFDEKFVFLGVLERLAESMVALAAALDKPLIDLPHLNATQRPDTDFDRWRDLYERDFADEYELYQAAYLRCA